MANLTLRNQKGVPLTNAEVDGNFAALNNDLVAHQGSGGSSHANATYTTSGFMSPADKQSLDRVVQSGADKIKTASWEIVEENGALLFKFNGVVRAKIDGSGQFIVVTTV